MAVDAFNVLHQFLVLIRTRDGTPLSDSQGRVTSHLVGLVFRTTRLIADHRMGLTFVFDGRPPRLKRGGVDRRRALRRRAEEEYWSSSLSSSSRFQSSFSWFLSWRILGSGWPSRRASG